MTVHDFIFSDRPRYRVTRHISLWVIFCLYFFIVNFLPGSLNDFGRGNIYLAAFHKMIYIPVSIVSAYVTAYLLLTKFLLKGKYLFFIILLISLCVVNLANAVLLTRLYALWTQTLPFDQLPVQIRVFQPVIYGLGLGTAAAVFACIARLLKIHYLKQKENERLEKLKIVTELEIIRTHFHPHFLSDALKNISSLIRTRSDQSADAILKLADLLSYFLYENDTERVSLQQEMSMVHAYLDLEKTFYGERIVVNVKEPEELDALTIAPLIIVSLVQHCCEQSLLSLQQKLTVDIEMEAEGCQLTFKLSCNGYHETINGLPQFNSALNQALKRVELLYPAKHHLETSLQDGIFSLQLFLESDIVSTKMNDKPEIELAYEPA